MTAKIAKSRICVLGNSHLGALKLGWDLIEGSYPGTELTFFGAPRSMMQDLVLEGTRLVPRTDKLTAKIRRSSGGLEAVEIEDYDAFILYGLQFGPRRLIQLYRTHRPISFEWREPLPELTPMEARPDQVQTVPERLFERAILTGLRQTMAMNLIAQIRSATGRPVHLITAPGFNEKAMDTGDWDGMLGGGDLERLGQRFRRMAGKACPPDVELYFPADHLVVHGVFTPRAHGVGETQAGRTDYVHTDPEYGAAMLRQVLDTAGVQRPANAA